jgi:hypothetical protein
VLVLAGRAEILKDHQKHEQVIDAQGFFDDVSGEELERFFGSPRVIDPNIEDHRQADPDNTLNRCFLDRNGVGFAVENTQIQSKHA